MRKLFPIALMGLIGLLFGSGCGFEIEQGGQRAGQECFLDADCVSGTRCVERRCRPILGSGIDLNEDGDGTDGDEGEGDGPGEGDGLGDGDHLEEEILPGGVCESGARGCAANEPYFCRGGTWVASGQVCGEGQVCREGDCEGGENICQPGETRCGRNNTIEFCYGSEIGWDPVGFCNDNEICANATCIPTGDGDGDPGDGDGGDGDSGDGTSTCCPGGCGPNQVCSGCQCQNFDLTSCTVQDQPCANEGQISNGYICADFAETSQLRCLGICNSLAPDPDATCPGNGPAICFAEEGNPNGLCVSSCNESDPCGDSRQRCLLFDQGTQDGFCAPSTGIGEVGDSCNGDDTFSCSGSNLCVEGICQRACRPFKSGNSDCVFGRSCFPFADTLGVCVPDSHQPDGSCTQLFTTCGQDATGCVPGGFGQFQCIEYCRLGSNDDCSDPATSCGRVSMDDDVLGFCQ